ncbi:MAG: hypothetical protein ACOX54_01420 [Christensenellales bacterium]|jgi:type II secretory pathway pseudopilin PulG|nr:hypothetical protein [Christensenellaceae bacterium]
MYRRPGMRRNVSFDVGNMGRRNVFNILFVVLIVAVIALIILHVRAVSYKNQVNRQFERQVLNAVVDALDGVSRLSSGVQSDSASKLSIVRQNVYLIERLNAMSTALGGEIFVPYDAMQILFEDINYYERLLQTGTSSTLEARDALLTHLTAVQEMIIK